MSKQLEITIPTELRDITLGKYQKIREFIEEHDVTEVEVSIKLIALMCDISIADVRDLQVNDFNEIVGMLTQALNKQPTYVKPPNFKIGETEYGFIPNLDSMTFGEYIDLDDFIKDEKNLHKTMTILYRPITHQSFGKYRIEKYTGNEDMEIMKDAPMDAVKSAMVFFWSLGKALLTVTQTSLEKESKKISQSNLPSELTGDGISQSMQYLTETLESLTKPQLLKFTKL